MKCGVTGFIKQIGDQGQLMPFKCGCWSCTRCARRNRRKVIALGKGGRPDKMLTLTVNPARFETVDEGAQALRSAFARMVEQLKRYHGHDDIQYMCIFEEHKSGWPHLHILIRSKFIPQKWISRFMRERIASPIVDIRKIKNPAQAALYVAKYIAKAPGRFQGCKRYWTSQRWAERLPKPIRDPRAIWVIVRDAYQFMEFRRLDLAYEFEGGQMSTPFSMPHPERARPAAPP